MIDLYDRYIYDIYIYIYIFNRFIWYSSYTLYTNNPHPLS